MHFTPTSASWLNMVERFFRDLTTERLRRGVFRCVPELICAIKEYIAVHNKDPKPFVWNASTNDILQKVIRANRRLGSKKNEADHSSIRPSPAARLAKNSPWCSGHSCDHGEVTAPIPPEMAQWMGPLHAI
jgi:hypothetical protein